MKWDKLEQLLQKYYNGETSVEEENDLKTFFKETPLLPDYLKPHAAQFKYYTQQQETEIDKFLDEDWLFEKIQNPEAKSASTKRTLWEQYWHVAASVVLLIVAFWAGNRFSERLTSESAPEMAAIHQELKEMKQILAVSTSASERIRVVSQDFTSVENEEVVQLLIKTLNQDPNVNVRLAACEALYQFRDDPKVRVAFMQALLKQTDPLVQITLIDILVGIKEKKAIEGLKQLTEKENLLPAVKQKAQQGLGTLI